MLVDYHMHSTRSADAKSSIIEMCKAAVEKGIAEICFTEHVDFEPTDTCYGWFDFDLYKEQITEVRELFGEKLIIGFGVEVDYTKKHEHSIREFLAQMQFDYVLGAAHYVGEIILEDHEKYFPGKEAYDAYMPYFENALCAVNTGLFDTLAHMDLCKRYGVRYYGKFDYSPYIDVIKEIFRQIISRSMALEINTSGLRQSPNETYPEIDLLIEYKAMGGHNITIGSDAHNANDVGSGIQVALEKAKSVGFEAINTFKSRKRTLKTIVEPYDFKSTLS